ACAVKDASAKAEVLAGAAGVTLGDLQNIDYSWGELNFYARPMESPLMAKGMAVNESARDSIDLDINPGDVQLSETVTLVWEIR
ncbi:MAG: SIMPL domain-containing protein, partial [Firmicutes bacterium]|nr:SIMPL domain-containing protein [Bacillota bacterium]